MFKYSREEINKYLKDISKQVNEFKYYQKNSKLKTITW